MSSLYRIEPDELEFTNGGEISLPWTVPSGLVPPGIAIYSATSADGPFEKMDDSYLNAAFSQATLLRSGYFFAGYPKSLDLASCP